MVICVEVLVLCGIQLSWLYVIIEA